ncbi:MAG: hypothetical protein EON87_06480 [Brevundimonas sp.]|nr:MAG: hypothetical protein EON87_06480 [Brevundimonas sp.]
MLRVSESTRSLNKYVVGLPLLGMSIKQFGLSISEVEILAAKVQFSDAILSPLGWVCFALAFYFLVIVIYEWLTFEADTPVGGGQTTEVPETTSGAAANLEAQFPLQFIIFAFETVLPFLFCVGTGLYLSGVIASIARFFGG